MKYLFLIIIFFAFVMSVNSQTTCAAGSVCVRQETVDKCAQIADELIAARDAIAKLKAAADAADINSAKAQQLIAAYEKLVAVGDRIQNEQNAVIVLYKDAVALYKDVVETQNKIILELETRLAKPQSAFSKFLEALKNAALIVGGVIIGRGL